jgi:Ser/Thr protein kinase RdoA (MazF antagonist)
MPPLPRPATTTNPDAADAAGQSAAGRSLSAALNQRSAVGSAVPSASVPSAVGGRLTRKDRQAFGSEELAVVLSHYALGPLKTIKDFPRGSRKAPKAVVQTADDQKFLLKRRATGRNDPQKVAFCHALQRHLAERQFPLPHLIGTASDGNSMLKWNQQVYELFEFIPGTPYDASLEATTEAGRTLAVFHKLLADYTPRFKPSRGSYHASQSVAASCNAIPTTLIQTEPAIDRREMTRRVQFLHQSYHAAAKVAEDEGLSRWPSHIAHSDWHPGNTLFRGQRVVAVIDYDAARLQQRIIDAANGALQFSIIGGGDDPEKWPEYLDESRFKRFLRGYDSVPDAVLSRAELRVLPQLMIEALIAESVIPIAATGNFARMPGGRFLPMVERKVRWIQKHSKKLIEMAEG